MNMKFNPITKDFKTKIRTHLIILSSLHALIIFFTSFYLD